MGRLDGKVALITGAVRGQGETEARLFAQEGAKVVLTDVLVEQGQQVAASIQSGGGEATFVQLDVSNPEEWTEVVRHTVQTYGRLDILISRWREIRNRCNLRDLGFSDPLRLSIHRLHHHRTRKCIPPRKLPREIQ